MNRTTRLIALLAGLVALSACDPGFDRISNVEKLRTLAIRVEPPEIGPGQVGFIDALAVAPDPAAIITYAWEVCFVTQGPDNYYACAVDEETGEKVGFDLGTTPEVSVPYDQVVAGFVASFGVDSLAEACDLLGSFDVPAFVELPKCEGGLPVTLRLTTSTGDGLGDNTEVSIRELVFLLPEEAARPDRNTNPNLDGVLINEVLATPATQTSVPLVEDEPVELHALVNPDASQEFTVEDEATGEAETKDEVLKITWFSTHGEVERAQTFFLPDRVELAELQNNKVDLLAKPAATTGTTVRTWVVLRDDRGGVDWIERRYVAQ